MHCLIGEFEGFLRANHTANCIVLELQRAQGAAMNVLERDRDSGLKQRYLEGLKFFQFLIGRAEQAIDEVFEPGEYPEGIPTVFWERLEEDRKRPLLSLLKWFGLEPDEPARAELMRLTNTTAGVRLYLIEDAEDACPPDEEITHLLDILRRVAANIPLPTLRAAGF